MSSYRKVGRDGNARIHLVEITLCAFYAPAQTFQSLTHNVSRTCTVYLRRRNIVTPAFTRACCIDA